MVPTFDSADKVFDLTLIHSQQQDEQQQSQSHRRREVDKDDLGMPASSDLVGKSSLARNQSDNTFPSLENTTEGTPSTEDDSSVSTIGSTMSSSRRLVFSKYWSATGQSPEPIVARRRSDSCSPMLGQPLRRSVIFSSSSYGSFSSLPGACSGQPMSMERKSVSVGDLSSGSHHRARGPPKSCLRRDPQYSGENSLRRSTYSFSISEDDILADDSASISSSSVRFDLEATDIRHFTPPQEVHAGEEWCNYFH